MFTELIEKCNPKPKFNLTWYNNEDSYCEGDIEKVIVDMIANNPPEDYTEAIGDKFSWSTYYHLTHVRKNILNWYPFKTGSRALEIGCGLGAITSVLCDNCKEVTSVELSKVRATGALLRCREYENLEIIVGNLNDIEFKEKYDYITLIGVLEYQGRFTDTDNPYVDFLKKIKGLLKEDGKLLIAIENQYGLKYWCGAREDHTGVPFDGMNQYMLSNNGIRTFSRKGLESVIKESGFKNTYFYYPMPDYKLPAVIYSEDVLPKNGNMMDLLNYYIPDTKTMVATENGMYDDLIDNGVFEFFANSFLVECSDVDKIGEIPFTKISCKRREKYRVSTKFTNEGKVIKASLARNNGDRHLNKILENEADLEKAGLKVLRSSLKNGSLESDRFYGQLLEDVLLKAYEDNDKEKIFEEFDKLYEQILTSSDAAPWEDNFLYKVDEGAFKDENRYGKILKKGFIDMLPQNAVYDNGDYIWFDQEWDLENVPAGFVMFRAIRYFYNSYNDKLASVIPMSALAQRYKLLNCWNDYDKMNRIFLGVVIDELYIQEESQFWGNADKDCIETIKKIMNY